MYRRNRWITLIIPFAFAVLLAPAATSAQESTSAYDTGGASFAEMAGPPQLLQLRSNAIQLIYLTSPIKRASIANPKIADIVVVSPKEIQVIGRAPGETSMVLWDRLDRAHSYTVSVSEHLPSQVLLRVKIGLIDRSKTRKVGIDGIFTGENLTAGAFWGRVVTPGIPLTLGPLTNAYVSHSPSHVEAAVQFMSSKGLLKVLAEPNLLARSGEEASFLVGGEFPYIVPQTTGAATATFTINYKEFGTKLKFTPTVLESEVIELKVAPEVSDLDFTQGLTFLGSSIPVLRTRKAETMVELKDGQSLIIAGLIEQKDENVKTGIPGLKEIPLLGYLFRSTEVRRTETELMIIVTPALVRPAAQVPLEVPAEELAEDRRGRAQTIMRWEMAGPRNEPEP